MTQNGLRKKRLLMQILAKHKLATGWGLVPDEQIETMVDVWVEILDQERVSVDAYQEIYSKALKQIAKATADGRKPPEFNAMLMASVWVGDSELRWKYAPRANQIMANSELERCKHCLGTGWEYVKESYPREVARCRCGKIPGQKF